MWARKKFNSYVWGSKIKFVTDHHALCWLLSKRELAGRLSRWALSLQGDYLTIVHKNGSRHIDADALSRYPIDNSEPTQSEEFDVPDDPYPMFMMHYVTDKGVDETGRTGSSEEQKINSKLVTRRHFDNLEKTVEKENFDPPIIQEERRRGRPRKQWNDPYAKHLNSLEKESESQKVKQKRRPRVKEVTDKKYVSVEQRPAQRSPRLVNLLLITFFLMKIILVGCMNVVQREGVLFYPETEVSFSDSYWTMTTDIKFNHVDEIIDNVTQWVEKMTQYHITLPPFQSVSKSPKFKMLC